MTTRDEIRSDVRTLSADAQSSWRELRQMAAHAPRPVRQYRTWSSFLGVTVVLLGFALAAVAPSTGPPLRWFIGWSAVVTIGNGAFLVMLAFPPRRTGAHKIAWRFSVLWMVISGVMCLPLMIFAVPAFVCISDAKCVGWYRGRERPTDGPPHRPCHPWGFPREPPSPPDAPPPPRAA